MSSAVSGWSDTRKRLCVLTVLLAAAASGMMQTFLTVSLPTATAELDAVAWYGWIAGIYLVTATAFIPPWAILSDRIGPRTVHVAGMALWALGTFAVSLADAISWLLMARAFQGIGAAAVVPAGFGAITAVYHDRYGRLIGLLGSVQAGVTLAGGPLGGWLGSWLGWRASLQAVAVFAVLPILLGWFTLPSRSGPPARTEPARLLTSTAARRAVAQTMLLAVIAFGLSSFLPLLLQFQFRLDLARTAVLTTPTLLGVAIGSAIGGIIAERRDTTPIAWGIVLAGVLLAGVPFVAAATIGSAFAAAGVGFGLPSQLIAAERVATAAHASKAGGLIQGARNIGGAIGVAVLGIPLQLGATPAAGARSAYALMLGLAGLAAITTALVAGRHRRDEQ